jgi:hypothetical protein
MSENTPLEPTHDDDFEDEALDRTDGGKLTATAGICFCKP